MKKCLALAATAAFLASTNGAANAYPYQHPQDQRVPSCKFRLRDGRSSFSVDEVRWTITCAVRRWPVPGGKSEAMCVARRESGLQQFAANPYSSARGVYQIVSGTWDSMRHRFHRVFRRQHMAHSVLNARSNVLAAIRSVHGAGWAPWSGGC